MALGLPRDDQGELLPQTLRPSGNPVLDEIHQAHASLSPAARSAIEQSGTAMPQAPQQPAASPAAPAPIAPMAATQPMNPVPANSSSQPLAPLAAPSIPVRPLGGDPSVAPQAQTHQSELDRLTTGKSAGSGIDQIKNPWVRRPLQVLDAIGSGLLPALTMGIPGTEAHHQLLVHQAAGAHNQDVSDLGAASKRGLEDAQSGAIPSEVDLRKAQTDEATAKTEALRNPTAKAENEGKTIETDQGVMQWDPETKRYDIRAGGPKEGKPAGTVHQLDDGTLIMAHPDGSATQITIDGKPAKGKVAEKEPNQYADFKNDYMAGHPGASAAEIQKAFEKNKAAPERPMRSLFVDPETNKLIEAGPGTVLPKGAVTASGMSGENVSEHKGVEAEKKARADAASEYQKAQSLVEKPSPTNDVALIMRYIGATKPDSLGKLRLNNNEINLVTHTRGLLGDAEALLQRAQNGQMLTPQQRKDMLGTMRTLSGNQDQSDSGVEHWERDSSGKLVKK